MSTSQLRTLWHRYYHVPVPKGLSRDLLIRFIAYRLQEEAQGGLGKATLRRLEALGARLRCPDGADSRCLPASLRPGTTLVREWNGTTHMVLVLEDGFEYRGERFPSLTKVAAAISGLHRSGPAFFGLKRDASRFAEQGRGFARAEVRDV
ncbi:DUF2924 domain-containing protein [Aestuariivirga sp.]|uniref:DUF2924 domain-containing protein n=1 Tax=Aestuariivirga sp. TaxID=2650926 RepID=UPI003BAD99A5